MKTPLYFYTADWCQACKQIKPRVVKLADKHNCHLIILDVEKDVDQNINVKSLPAFQVGFSGFSHWAFNYNDLESILRDGEY